jgi:hypothetical protein
VLDQTGLAGTQWPGDDVGGNVLQHDRGFLRGKDAVEGIVVAPD